MIIAFLGIFVFGICFLFKPFRLDNFSTPELFVASLVNGAFVFLALLISQLVFSRIFGPQHEEEWTFLKEIMAFLWHFAVYGILAFVTVRTFGLGQGDLSDLYVYTFKLPLLGSLVVLPVIMILKKNLVMQRNRTDVAAIKSIINATGNRADGQIVEIASNDKSKNLKLPAQAIFAFKASENYVAVFYNDDTHEKSELLRTTLKKVSNDLKKNPVFFQCHRSYIVNLDKIDSVKGNSKGYTLKFLDSSLSVPVARSLIEPFKHRLKGISMS